MKARRVKKLDPAAPLTRTPRASSRSASTSCAPSCPAALEPATRRGPARHADRREAAALHPRSDRLLLRQAGRHRARRRARDLQGLLGEMHDCDVMLPRVEAPARRAARRGRRGGPRQGRRHADLDPRLAARAPHRTAYRGLEVLAVYLQARRELLFDRFVEFWERQEEAGTWVRLERAVDARLQTRPVSGRRRPSAPEPRPRARERAPAARPRGRGRAGASRRAAGRGAQKRGAGRRPPHAAEPGGRPAAPGPGCTHRARTSRRAAPADHRRGALDWPGRT